MTFFAIEASAVYIGFILGDFRWLYCLFSVLSYGGGQFRVHRTLGPLTNRQGRKADRAVGVSIEQTGC